MLRNLTPQQVVMLLGTGLVIAGVLVFIIYTLHKSLRRQRAEEECNFFRQAWRWS